MRTELKARIKDVEQVESTLLGLGVAFEKECVSNYSYFNQPSGKVLKLTTTRGITRRITIERAGNKFKITGSTVIENPAEEEAKLTQKYGLKRNLSNKRRYYTLRDQTITTNQIGGLGNFLIIEAEAPDPSLLEKLQISIDSVVTESFDNL